MSTIYTVGHSTRTVEEFIGLLKCFGIGLVADIRTLPKSRHNPQFHIDRFPGSLASAGIDYRHLPGLGGLRRPAKESINTGWRNASFRGYADYMSTPPFQDAVAELIAVAAQHITVIMCAEAVFWRCHRALVADALLVRGVDVQHIIGAGKLTPATMTASRSPTEHRSPIPRCDRRHPPVPSPPVSSRSCRPHQVPCWVSEVAVDAQHVQRGANHLVGESP